LFGRKTEERRRAFRFAPYSWKNVKLEQFLVLIELLAGAKRIRFSSRLAFHLSGIVGYVPFVSPNLPAHLGCFFFIKSHVNVGFRVSGNRDASFMTDPPRRKASYPMSIEDKDDLARELAEFGYRETSDPDDADRRNYYKVELWDADELHVKALLHASNDLSRAKAIFAAEKKRGPRGRYTLRQGIRVLDRWPPERR
jgi:hypothetical protein